MQDNLKQKTISSMFWQFMQGIGGQFVSFWVGIILARLLSPTDYGVVAIAGMFLGILGMFADGGLAQAVIQKKDADETDFNTMFVTQLVFSSIIFVVIYFLAPYFADLFHNDQLILLIRVMALTMPLGSLAGVQYCVVSRRLMFRWFFYASTISLFASATVGVWMAYSGFGPWALVGQRMSATIVNTVVVFCLLDWHPKFQFSLEHFKELFRQGLKYLGSTFIGTITAQVKDWCLGLKYSPADLAYYNKGGSVPNMFCNNIDSTIQSVLFPAISQIQDDKERVRNAIRRSIRTSTFVLFPMLFGLSVTADKLIPLLYSDKWNPSIPFMQVLCISLAIGIMCNVNTQALKATGNIGIVLKLEFVKKPIMFLTIIGTMLISPLAIAWGILFFNIFVYFVNAYPNKAIISYSYLDQLKDVAPNLIQATVMTSVVYFVGMLPFNIHIVLIFQILIGILLYVAMSIIFRNESFDYVLATIKEKRAKK